MILSYVLVISQVPLQGMMPFSGFTVPFTIELNRSASLFSTCVPDYAFSVHIKCALVMLMSDV